MPGQLDLDQLVRRGTVELGPDEHPDERAARLRREERRDQREHALFYAALGGVSVLAVLCAWLVVFAGGVDLEQRRWAQTALTILVSGSVGFLTGRRLPAG